MKETNVLPRKESIELNNNHGGVNSAAFKKLYQVMTQSLKQHPRTLIYIYTLKLNKQTGDIDTPSEFEFIDISKVIASIKAKMEYHFKKKAEAKERVRSNRLRYFWCLEESEDSQPHYHLIIFLNADAFYKTESKNLHKTLADNSVVEAWGSHLGIDNIKVKGLVHKHDNNYKLNINKAGYLDMATKALRRLSYFCKNDTKLSGRGYRTFEGSRM